MPRIKTNVVGKVNNIQLPAEKSLMALHEAIVNSLQSIDDAQRNRPTLEGKIEIEVRRDPNGSPIDGLQPVKDIVIEDNGVGFTKNNYVSFQTAESTYKLNRGCKGIGRFLWLKVFDHAEIRSVYKDLSDQKLHKRSFSFILNDKDPIVDPQSAPLLEDSNKSSGTKLFLRNIKPEYVEPYSIPLEELADSIIEHHIDYLVDNSCPDIILRENISHNSSTQFNLKNRFQQEFLLDKDADSVEISSYTFHIAFLYIKNEDGKARHSILYSGNKRVVVSKSLASLIPNLQRPLQDGNGQLFDVFVLVSSIYLDQHVNRERTELNIPEKAPSKKTLGRPLLSLEEIQAGVLTSIHEHLDEFLVAIREEKQDYIREFVESEAPQYKSLLKYTERIDKIKLGLSYDKLDIELHKLRNDLVIETRIGVGRILNQSQANHPNTEDFTKDLQKIMGMINDMTKSDLADYVVQRKMILMLFEKALKLTDDNTYEKESRIHNIVFPMRKTSDEVDYSEHNLWLIDERLSYHRYLRSDKPLDEGDKDSPKPDIILTPTTKINKNLLYTDSQSAPFDTFTIIEFKRPMRDYYSGQDDDPIAQVQRYVNYVHSGKAKTDDGRPINPKGAKFYCYVICDLIQPVRDYASDRGFTETADGEGYFWYNPNTKAYFEVISFDKLIKDAKQRNQILFDKLGIGRA
ncbi:hypothetical protein [Hymenobacter perfusus]|uniref:ATP-binding protein n=1 Tax=Hymenobacter perfusus TaxID=1236770 RepID=A0A428KDY9_9BACT|nr:hypothetical protein [Hymenobacter perfusus]RSK44677.1 hypothetical protein EI293_09205 [Hymenobacter perfusus]